MRINKFLLSCLVLIIIVLGSALFLQYQTMEAMKLPYAIGSPVVPSSQMPMGMVMKTFPVPSNELPPTIGFTIQRDTMNGWDVHVTTTNFAFTPDQLNGTPVPGAGHVHLYIDNQLIILLEPWYHIDSLTPGAHLIKVGLFNNDHSAYVVHGQQIEAQTQLNVPKS